MAWTRNQIASAIKNNVTDALQGSSNFAFSLEQLEREIESMRAAIAFEVPAQHKGKTLQGFYQNFNGIKIDNSNIAKLKQSHPSIKNNTKHFQIPPVAPDRGINVIDYIGPVQRNTETWKVYYDSRFRKHRYKRAISEKPYVYIDCTAANDEGFYDGFIFNISTNLKQLSITAIIENTTDVEWFQNNGGQWWFPAPEWAVDMIIKRVSQKYIQFYRQANAPIQPNTQTDQVT